MIFHPWENTMIIWRKWRTWVSLFTIIPEILYFNFFKCIYFDRRKTVLSAFNLIEGFDVPAIEEKIARYQEENAEQIMINRARKVQVKSILFPALNICHICPWQVDDISIHEIHLMP